MLDQIMQEYYPSVECYNLHWSLKTQMWEAFRRDVERPQPGITYLCYDFEDSAGVYIHSRAKRSAFWPENP